MQILVLVSDGVKLNGGIILPISAYGLGEFLDGFDGDEIVEVLSIDAFREIYDLTKTPIVRTSPLNGR